MRTTLDIEEPILQELKKRQRITGQSLSKLASSLLAEALSMQTGIRSAPEQPAVLDWQRQAMGARVDLSDKDALYRAMGEG